MMARLAPLLLLLPALAAAQTVEGTVANSSTGAPIPGVKVQLIWSGDIAYTATTDAQGHFLLDHVQTGTYSIWYTATDYSLFHSDAARQIAVTAGAPVKLEARMTPLAKVSGRVVDGRGDPAPGAGVAIVGPQSAMSLTADAQGRFELHQMLIPGAYTLSASPPPNLKPPDPEPEGGGVLNWVRTWYPAGSSAQAASKIVLAAGSEVSDLEIKLLALPAHAVRGVLLNPAGDPVPQTDISLAGDMAKLHAVSKTDGAFEFPAVVDGEWSFTAEVAAGNVKLRAADSLETTGRDVEGVKLRLEAPFTLRGKAVFETPKGAPLPRLAGVALSSRLNRAFRELIPDNGILASVAPGSPDARADAEGNLVWPTVYPGSYRIVPMGAPPGYYLDSIRVGESEPSTPEVQLFSPAASITLLYKTNGGSVQGTAENCASGGVLLIPLDPVQRRSGFFYSRSCQGERYQMAAVRPGDYLLLAFPGDDPEPWSRAVVDDAALSQATKVTVRAGETTSVDLRAIAPTQR